MVFVCVLVSVPFCQLLWLTANGLGHWGFYVCNSKCPFLSVTLGHSAGPLGHWGVCVCFKCPFLSVTLAYILLTWCMGCLCVYVSKCPLLSVIHWLTAGQLGHWGVCVCVLVSVPLHRLTVCQLGHWGVCVCAC